MPSAAAEEDVPSPLLWWRRAAVPVMLGALAATAIADQVRLIVSVTRTIATGDQTTAWYAAREWGRFRPHQLNFYGQAYGSSFEAIPLEVLRSLRIQFSTATPVVWTLLATTGWFALAWVAWRRAKPVLAALALAFPVLLSAYHSFFVGTLGSSLPRLFGVLGAAILMLKSRRTTVLARAWALLGLGVVFDGAVALLAIPVAAWYLLSTRLERRDLHAILVGAVLPTVLLVFSWWFYRVHPDYSFHGSTSSIPSPSRLVRHLGDLKPFFDLYVPEVLRSWIVPIAVLVALVVALLASRRAALIVPAVSVPVLIAWALAVPKSEGPSARFLPSGRVLVMLPATLWFLAFILADAQILRRPRWLTARLAVGVVTVLALVTFNLRNVDFDNRVVALRDDAVAAGAMFQRTSALLGRCQAAQALAHRVQASLVVYVQDGTSAYGCGALFCCDIQTLVPFFERRTWRLYNELHRKRTSMVMVDTAADFCEHAMRRVRTCDRRGQHTAIVTFPPQSALRVLTALDVDVRPFGPDCHYHELQLRGDLTTCDRAVDTSPEPTGAAPPDEASARGEIAAAFAAMLRSSADGQSVPTVEDGTGLGPFATHATACQPWLATADIRVDDLTFVDNRFAFARFSVSRSGSQVFKLQGSSVIVDGRWVVGNDAFQMLLQAVSLLCKEPSS